MIIFAKICISDDYRGFILLFVHPAKKKLEPHRVLTEVAPTGIEPVFETRQCVRGMCHSHYLGSPCANENIKKIRTS